VGLSFNSIPLFAKKFGRKKLGQNLKARILHNETKNNFKNNSKTIVSQRAIGHSNNSNSGDDDSR
jgi:hypothetical protein